MHECKVISKDTLSDAGELLFIFCVSPGCRGVLQSANVLYCDVVSFRKTNISCPGVNNGVFEEGDNTKWRYIIHLC
jgi:hypothetical protein